MRAGSAAVEHREERAQREQGEGRPGIKGNRTVAEDDAVRSGRERDRAQIAVRGQDRDRPAVNGGLPSRVIEIREDENTGRARVDVRGNPFGKIFGDPGDDERTLPPGNGTRIGLPVEKDLARPVELAPRASESLSLEALLRPGVPHR